MKGFAIGLAASVVLSALTYVAMQAGSVQTADKYAPDTVILGDSGGAFTE